MELFMMEKLVNLKLLLKKNNYLIITIFLAINWYYSCIIRGVSIQYADKTVLHDWMATPYIQDPFIPVFYSNAMSISNVLFHIGALEIFSLVPSKLY